MGKYYHGSVQASTHATITEKVSTYSPISSISKNHLDQIGLSFFPNPTSDILVVQSYAPTNRDLKIELIDINGKLVMTDILKQGSTMSYLNLEVVYSGIYYVKISDSLNSITKKIVVAH